MERAGSSQRGAVVAVKRRSKQNRLSTRPKRRRLTYYEDADDVGSESEQLDRHADFCETETDSDDDQPREQLMKGSSAFSRSGKSSNKWRSSGTQSGMST